MDHLEGRVDHLEGCMYAELKTVHENIERVQGILSKASLDAQQTIKDAIKEGVDKVVHEMDIGLQTLAARQVQMG